MKDFKSVVGKLLKGLVPELEEEEILGLIETPPDPKMGDFAFPAFSLAKSRRKNPAMIATEIADGISSDEVSAKAMGPYVNFFVGRDVFAKTIMDEVLEKGMEFGKSHRGDGETIVLDYSSPNIAKPFHIGHIRTTVIGDAIKRIYDYQGFKTVAVNHLGDYGTQFGLMIEAYLRWGDREVIEENPIPELVKLYVRINTEAKENPELLENGRKWFVRLEQGDEEAVKLWKWFREVSLKDFQRVYDLLGITFDSYRGESYYSDLMPAVVEELEEKGLLVDSQGAKIVELEEYKLPPAIIVKSDGSTIYVTRDLATAKFRKETYNFAKNVYVVGTQQILHFQQLFAILDKMGYTWARDCVHVPFGMVSLPEGTLSTRRGNVVYLEDVLNKAIDKVDEILKEREEERGFTLEGRQTLAKQVGIGAVKFQELFNQRIKDYTFDWERTLSFEGETGPYVQYTHARIASLLRRGEFSPEDSIDPTLLKEEDESLLLRSLYDFEGVITDACKKHEPYLVTRHIVEAAKTFNKYYTRTTVLTEDEDLARARLALAYGVKCLIARGLDLLGIEAPESM